METTGSDSNAALAAEEDQPVRQLGILELVVAGSAHNSGQDADEGVAGDLLEGDVGSGAFFQGADHADHAGVQQLLHHQEADQTGQTCGAVVVARPTAAPMANSHAMLSIRAPPALTSRKPTV